MLDKIGCELDPNLLTTVPRSTGHGKRPLFDENSPEIPSESGRSENVSAGFTASTLTTRSFSGTFVTTFCSASIFALRSASAFASAIF